MTPIGLPIDRGPKRDREDVADGDSNDRHANMGL